MSYILEALKKAQAERQLGAMPTIDAVSIHVSEADGGASRKPLWFAVGAALIVAALGAMAWWRMSQPEPPVVMLELAHPMPAALPPSVAVPGQGAAPAVVALPLPPPQSIVIPQAQPAPVPAARPAPAPAPARVVAYEPPARAPAPEEALPFARDLPEQVRGGLPQVAFGGYMYSPNPADRLLLIDKVLRREGDEVAPGLMLEKLLPTAAVMNYRGTRYRVAY